MLVLDMEWVEKKDGQRSPTQLYASRVDERWNPIETFSTLIRPDAAERVPWQHIAYSGYSRQEFLAAPDLREAVQSFFAWMQPGEKALCWHSGTKMLLMHLGRQYTGNGRDVYACANKKVRAAVLLEKENAGGMYDIAKAYDLSVPAPEHCSKNDTEVLLQLLRRFDLPPEGFAVPSQPSVPKTKEELRRQRRAKNEARVEKLPYPYLSSPGSGVFHCKSCRLILCAKIIEGASYYETAAKKRVPCRVCKPDAKPRVEKNQKQRSRTVMRW